jgi:putative transcriptional regulator
MSREIYTLNQYGHIEINIREIMDNKGISRNALARSINTRFEVIDKWYHGHVEKIDADILAEFVMF